MDHAPQIDAESPAAGDPCDEAAAALSAPRGAALYIGALLGPALLLLPGLAASIAGPASIVAWAGLLIVSGLLAVVFAALGRRFRPGSGVVDYAAAGLGRPAGSIAGWCFLGGVITGLPAVCLVGATYLADLVGGGRITVTITAAGLVLLVVGLTLGGLRTTTTAQLALVATMVAIMVIAVVAAAPSAHRGNWTPFAPHGAAAVGRAASVLMFSFIGWEAVAPLTSQLRDPDRALPRVIGAAYVTTTVLYLALAAATVGVLGPGAGSAVPIADLLRVGIGPAGSAVATVAALALTLGATNAYLSGAVALLRSLVPGGAERTGTGPRGAAGSATAAPPAGMLVAIGTVSVFEIGLYGAQLVGTASLVAIPTTLFLTVYLACTASAARILRGGARFAGGAAAACVVGVLVFAGWTLLAPVAVASGAAMAGARQRRGPSRAAPVS